MSSSRPTRIDLKVHDALLCGSSAFEQHLIQVRGVFSGNNINYIHYLTVGNTDVIPLHDALKQQDCEVAKLYLKAVEEVLSADSMRTLLQYSTRKRFNCLHQIGFSGNLNNLSLYIEYVQKYFQKNAFSVLSGLARQQCFPMSIYSGYLPNNRVKINNCVDDQMDYFFSKLRMLDSEESLKDLQFLLSSAIAKKYPKFDTPIFNYMLFAATRRFPYVQAVDDERRNSKES